MVVRLTLPQYRLLVAAALSEPRWSALPRVLEKEAFSPCNGGKDPCNRSPIVHYLSHLEGLVSLDEQSCPRETIDHYSP